jgi:hypothetical protein
VGQDPRFPELSVANIRLACRIGARTRDDFDRELPRVGWFARLGYAVTVGRWLCPDLRMAALAGSRGRSGRGVRPGPARHEGPHLRRGARGSRSSCTVRPRKHASDSTGPSVRAIRSRSRCLAAPTLCVREAGYTAALVACLLVSMLPLRLRQVTSFAGLGWLDGRRPRRPR